jgi:hypothetical protein
MQIRELIGRKIANIYELVKTEAGGLDTGECFIEFDDHLIIGIPYDTDQEVAIKELDPQAVSLFTDLSDIPIYHVNPEHKTIGELAAGYQQQNGSLLLRIRSWLLGHTALVKAYQPYKVDYHENKLKYLQGRAITDFIWYNEMGEKGYFLLDNGLLLTETTTAPNGTGLTGINYYDSLSQLTAAKGSDFCRLRSL